MSFMQVAYGMFVDLWLKMGGGFSIALNIPIDFYFIFNFASHIALQYSMQLQLMKRAQESL